MSQQNLFENPRLFEILQTASKFMSVNNLRLKAICPLITTQIFDNFLKSPLTFNKNVNLSLTFELEPIEQDQEGLHNTPSTNTTSYINLSHPAYTEPLTREQSQRQLSQKHSEMNNSIALETEKEVAWENIEESVVTLITQSKIQHPNYADQLNKIYDMFQTYKFDLSLKPQIEKSALKVNWAVESELKTSHLKSSRLEDSVHINMEEASRLHKSYFKNKINQLFDEHRSKIIQELQESIPQIQDQNSGFKKSVLSKLMLHYDSLKSQFFLDLTKIPRDSFVESQINESVLEVSYYENIIQGFIKNLPDTKFELAADGEDVEQTFAKEKKEQSSLAKLNVSTFLQQELKMYMSQIFKQNLKSVD